jgi:hypothetical protein
MEQLDKFRKAEVTWGVRWSNQSETGRFDQPRNSTQTPRTATNSIGSVSMYIWARNSGAGPWGGSSKNCKSVRSFWWIWYELIWIIIFFAAEVCWLMLAWKVTLTHSHTYTHTHTHPPTHAHAHAHTRARARTYTHTHMHAHTPTHAHTHTHTHTHVHTTHTYFHIRTHSHTSTYVQACMCARTHIHTHT